MKNRLLFSLILCFLFCFSVNGQAAETYQALIIKGTQAFEQGDYKTAIKFFEAVIQINPHYAPAYNFAAMAYKNDGADISKVEIILKRGIKMDPTYAPFYDNLSKIYYGLGRFDEAQENAEKALERDPELISAEQSLGWIYLVGREDAAKAIEAFEKVVAKQKIPFAYLGLGIAYMMNNQKLLVLDTITELRNLNEDNFASELEKMLRQEDYRPAIKALHPLRDTKPVLTIEEHEYNAAADMPVRLKHDSYEQPLPNSPGAGQQEISPSERLRQLRRSAYPSEPAPRY